MWVQKCSRPLEITLCVRWHHPDPLFLINVNNGLKFYTSFMETVFACQLKTSTYFALFNVGSKYHSCSSTRCTSATNAICADIGIFR